MKAPIDRAPVLVVMPEWWKAPSRRFVIMESKARLLKVILTRHASCRFPSSLHRRQKQSDQDPDDRDHDQKFHKGEGFLRHEVILLKKTIAKCTAEVIERQLPRTVPRKQDNPISQSIA